MTLKNILVPLVGNAQDTIALDAAGKLALRFGAHLEALHISSTGDAALPFLGESTSGAVIDEIISRIEAEAEANAAKAKSVFESWEKDAGIPRGELSGDKTATVAFTQVTGDRDAILAARARCSDLIVFRAPQSEDDAGVASDVEVVLMESGRPLILVPKQVTDDFANKALIAWNDSIESTRAAAAAMPMLQNADSVTVAAVLQDNDAPPDLAGISALLSAHGADVGTTTIDANGKEISDVLVEHARRHAGTILVMGAYSHSRLREQVLGGVTQDILDFTEVPVMLVH